LRPASGVVRDIFPKIEVNDGTSTPESATSFSFLVDDVSLNCVTRVFRGEKMGSLGGGGYNAGKHVDDFSEKKMSVDGGVDLGGGGTDAPSFLEMR
jgi:hypothetical protein